MAKLLSGTRIYGSATIDTTLSLGTSAIFSGSTSGTTTLLATATAGTTTLTLPAATDTLVGKATTDTLTNKTLTGAVMNGTLGATTPSTVAATSISVSGTLGVSETGGAGSRLQITSTVGGAEIFQNDNSPIIFKTQTGPQEKMRITDAGGVSFGSTGTAYGTSGQVLTSAGNAPPTWTTVGGGGTSSPIPKLQSWSIGGF